MRKLIALSLTLAAVASFGAHSAAPATAAVGDFDLACKISFFCKVKALLVSELALKVNGGTVKCTSGVLEGSSTAAEGGTEVITKVGGGRDWAIHVTKLHPTFSGCTFIGQTATVATTECNYLITPSSKTAGTMAISCEAGKDIVVEATTSKCTVKIGSQTPINNALDFTVQEAGGVKDVLVTPTVGSEPIEKGKKTGIKYTSSGGACGESGENGTYRGSATLKGYSDEAHENQVSLTLVVTVSATESE